MLRLRRDDVEVPRKPLDASDDPHQRASDDVWLGDERREEGDAGALGKTAGKDAADDKPTYPSLFGLERARPMAADCADLARAILVDATLEATSLPAIADWVLTRKN